MNILGEDGYVSIDSLSQALMLSNEDRGAADRLGQRHGLSAHRGLARRVSRGEPPAITGEDGLAAMELALAAYRSVETGRPVKLPL